MNVFQRFGWTVIDWDAAVAAAASAPTPASSAPSLVYYCFGGLLIDWDAPCCGSVAPTPTPTPPVSQSEGGGGGGGGPRSRTSSSTWRQPGRETGRLRLRATAWGVLPKDGVQATVTARQEVLVRVTGQPPRIMAEVCCACPAEADEELLLLLNVL